MFSGFTFGVDSISEEFLGFSPYGFPKENSVCLLSLDFLLLCMLFSQLKILRS